MPRSNITMEDAAMNKRLTEELNELRSVLLRARAYARAIDRALLTDDGKRGSFYEDACMLSEAIVELFEEVDLWEPK